MYAVSDEYKKAIAGASRTFKIRANIYLRDSTVLKVDDSTIIGKVTIGDSMMSGSPSDDMIDIGAAQAKKLEMTVLNRHTNLHVFSGARLWLYVSLKLESGAWEDVPMGKFYINNKSISRVNNLVTFSAYDGMVLLHYELTAEMRQELKGKTAMEAAQILCRGLLLVSTAVSPAGGYVECPNTDIPLDFDSAQIETARDGIMWIAQLMGCFARVNRLGVLEFVPIKSWWKMYDETTGTILAVRNIQGNERYKTTFADDRIHIVGVSMRGADGKLVTQRYSYSHNSGEDPTSDVTVEMKTNPLVMSSEKPLSAILGDILKELSTAYFYSFSTDIVHDPALDAGDTIRLQGGVINGTNHNNDLIGFITHSVWQYRGKQTITNASSVPIVFDGQDDESGASSKARAAAASTFSARSGDDLNYLPPRSQSEKALQGINSVSELVGNFGGRYVFKWLSPYEIAAINPDGDRVFYCQNASGGGIIVDFFQKDHSSGSMEKNFHISTSGGILAFNYGNKNQNGYVAISSDHVEVGINGKPLIYIRNDGYVKFSNDFWASPNLGLFQFKGFNIDTVNGTIELNGKRVFTTQTS